MASVRTRRPLLARPAGPSVLLARIVPAVPAVALVLGLACTAAAAAGQEAPRPHHWGFGWDPGESGEGVTLRYQFRPGWDLSLAGGPNDFRNETERRDWDTADDVVPDGALLAGDNRQEQGWVRLTAAGRFWDDGRIAVHGVGAATYRWSVEEVRTREPRDYGEDDWDWYNLRDHTDRDSWWLTLGLRPSYAVTDRFQVEFEGGVRLRFETIENSQDAWWDAHIGTTSSEHVEHDRLFQTYGGFEWYRLRFIFWF